MNGPEVSTARSDLTSARQLAFDLLLAVETEGAYANIELPKLFEKTNLDKRDRGFAQELGYGTIRWQMQYQEIIAILAGDREVDTDVSLWLQLGMHQLFRMRVPVHAAIGETVELAKQGNPKISGFVNALLRRASEKSLDDWMQKLIAGKSPVEKLAIQYSHPKWIVAALMESLQLDGKSESLEQLLNAHQISPTPQFVALPPNQFPEDSIATDLSSFGFESETFALQPGYRYQDQGSQYVTEVAAAFSNPGRWLDMCAGPGGKAALLAALALKTQTSLDAIELHPHRANLVKHALAQYSNTKVMVADATKFDDAAGYDLVLVDAPCSGLGALRRKPEARYRRTPADIVQLVKLQNKLLSQAINLAKSGGVVAYITCSPLPQETVGVVRTAMEDYAVKLIDLNVDSPEIERKTMQLWSHLHESDSMFMALLRKQ